MSSRDEGPVYYREIQKNTYLTRLPSDVSSGKLRPLGSKKVPNRPMWTQLCVHNGRTPYLEQYPEPDSAAALAHRPVWRASLRAARHITASVKPHCGDQYDFLIDTDNGAVRMLAPDWESMQDWVATLRNTLHELKIVGRGENVYCAAPAAPAPRAAARDPNSPLPPTPPIPPDRVPGIDLTPNIRTQPPEPVQQPEPSPEPEISDVTPPEAEQNVDISNWDAPFTSLPSTSQNRVESKTGVAKICGQNICLDDSIFKRTSDVADSDEEFMNDIDNAGELDIVIGANDYKQTLVVSEEKSSAEQNDLSNDQANNITVIQVSNKDPPHTAIPVLGPETDVFNFDFKQNLTITDPSTTFVNIVNTEQGVYEPTSDYGHLSLTTTVNLTGATCQFPVKTDSEELYERLCLASTSKKPSPLPVKKLKKLDKNRKSSLPNLDVSDTTYEYLFLSNNNTNSNNQTGGFNSSSLGSRNNLNIIADSTNIGNQPNSSSNECNIPNNFGNLGKFPNNSSIACNLSNNSGNLGNLPNNTDNTSNNSGNVVNLSNNSSNVSNLSHNSVNLRKPSTNSGNLGNLSNNSGNSGNLTNNSGANHEVNSNGDALRILASSVDPESRSLERSRSQNEYDSQPRARETDNLIRRVQNNSPKREAKIDKPESHTKPIWKRGLTEISLRIRAQLKRTESPSRNDNDSHDRTPVVTSPVKVVQRSRPEVRVDSARRRSSSLSNGVPPPSSTVLQPLRARQAAELRAEQRRAAALVAEVPSRPPLPVFVDYNKQVWVGHWGSGAGHWGGRVGDRVRAVRGSAPRDAQHAAQLLRAHRTRHVHVLFHRVPLGNIYVINKTEQENLGIKLDSECNIIHVESDSAAGRAGIPPPGKWAVTEVNNRPINLIKGGEDDMNRLSMHGSEVSILIQPSALVKKLRAALKSNKTLLGLR